MLKIITSKSEIGKLKKVSLEEQEPIVTVLFRSKTANVYSDISPAGLQLSNDQWNSLLDYEKNLIKKYRKEICKYSTGKVCNLKINIKYAYRFALELAGILYRYAGLEAPREESVDGLPVAPVIYITEHQLHIRCPYCGQVHHHGRESHGRMEAHCQIIEPGCESYFIASKD